MGVNFERRSTSIENFFSWAPLSHVPSQDFHGLRFGFRARHSVQKNTFASLLILGGSKEGGIIHYITVNLSSSCCLWGQQHPKLHHLDDPYMKHHQTSYILPKEGEIGELQ